MNNGEPGPKRQDADLSRYGRLKARRIRVKHEVEDAGAELEAKRKVSRTASQPGRKRKGRYKEK